jgi:hypothetical protein
MGSYSQLTSFHLLSVFYIYIFIFIYMYEIESLFICLSVCCWAVVAFSLGSILRFLTIVK